MDDADNAQQYIDREREASIARALAAQTEQPLTVDGVHVCLDCHEPLDSRRLLALPNAVRCVNCQTEREMDK